MINMRPGKFVFEYWGTDDGILFKTRHFRTPSILAGMVRFFRDLAWAVFDYTEQDDQVPEIENDPRHYYELKNLCNGYVEASDLCASCINRIDSTITIGPGVIRMKRGCVEGIDNNRENGVILECKEYKKDDREFEISVTTTTDAITCAWVDNREGDGLEDSDS